MKKVTIFITLLVITFTYFGINFSNNKVYALDEISSSSKDEYFTQTDKLKNDDGSFLNNKIFDFANYVNDASYNEIINDLEKVIPNEYLNSKENITHYYFGEEYGYYFVIENDYLDLLLVDVSYDMEDENASDLEHKIRIKPILQERFLREVDNDNEYIFRKNDNNASYQYFITKPRFLVESQNANSLNYGDEGYSKENDDGTIITQSRVNYGTVNYMTNKEIGEELASLVVEKAFTTAIGSIPIYGTAISLIYDLAMGSSEIMIDAEDTVIETNNENNIYTEQSKAAQKNNSELPSYSRLSIVSPKDEVLLSDADNSYAEVITVLNDSNSRTRLYQQCDFEIYRRYGNHGELEKMIGNNEDESYSFRHFKNTYNNASITTMNNNALNKDYSVYLLDNGDQYFTFDCMKTSNYQLNFNNELINVKVLDEFGQIIEINKVNSNRILVNLEEEKKYQIILSSISKIQFEFNFSVDSIEIEALGEQNVPSLVAGESSDWYSYKPNEDCYLSISYDPSLYIVDVYDSNGNIIKNVGDMDVYFEANKQYFFYVTNITDENLARNGWFLDKVDEINLGDLIEIKNLNGQKVYRFKSLLSGLYELDTTGNITAYIKDVEDDNGYYLEESEYYIIVEGNLELATLKVDFNVNEIKLNQEIDIKGGLDSLFLEFDSPANLNYKIELSDNLKIDYLIKDYELEEIKDNNYYLNENKIYYFRIVAKDGKLLPNIVSVLISVDVTDSFLIFKNELDVSFDCSGSGIQTYEIYFESDNFYEISGLTRYLIYDEGFNKMNIAGFFQEGKYYLLTSIPENRVITLNIVTKGKQLAVKDVISVNSSSFFKYELEQNKVYEIRFIGSVNGAYNHQIKLYNSLGDECELDRYNRNLYLFEASDTTMFLEVNVMILGEGACILTVLPRDMTLGNEYVQLLVPETIYPLGLNSNKSFFKVNAGDYKLHIKKKIGESILLFKISPMSSEEKEYELIEGETLLNSTEVEYHLNTNTTSIYMIYSNYLEVDCMLYYTNGNYVIGVKEQNISNNTLFINCKYEFLVYRVVEDNYSLVSSFLPRYLDIYEGDSDGKLINNSTGNYIFTSAGSIYVTGAFFGIKVHSTFIVEEPVIEGFFNLDTNEFTFNLLKLNYESNIYDLNNLEIRIRSANNNYLCHNGNINKTISIDLTSYVWELDFIVEVKYYYNNSTDSFSLEKSFNYEIPNFKINSNYDLTNYEIVLLDGRTLNSNINLILTIPSNVKYIFFYGNSNKTIKYLNIIVQNSTTMNIYMRDFNYYFNDIGIHIRNNLLVNLNIIGECRIEPSSDDAIAKYGIYGYTLQIIGDGKLRVQAGKHESTEYGGGIYQSYSGIFAHNLLIGVNTLDVIGGEGGDGYPNLTFDGANGDDGGFGIQCIIDLSINVTCKEINITGGKGGDGADGQTGTASHPTGGTGGDGANGRNDDSTSASPTAGGNGGNGGRGGYSYLQQIYEIAGNGGNGGNGGDPGTIGGGLAGGNGGYGYNGGDGSNGNFAFAAGGNGGNGGDAYGGVVGSGGKGGTGILNSNGTDGKDGVRYSDIDFPN